MSSYKIKVRGLSPVICYVHARADIEAAGGEVISSPPDDEQRDLSIAADVVEIVVVGGGAVLAAVRALVDKYKENGGEADWREVDGYR